MINRWATLVIQHPLWVILITTLLAALMLAKLPSITLDTSTRGFLKTDHSAIVAYDDFRETFGRDEFIVVSIEADDIFTLEFLAALKSLHDNLYQALPYIQDVDSLINARNIYALEDELIIGDLFEELPDNQAELDKRKQGIITHPLYKKLLISEDGRFTNVLLKFQLEVKDKTTQQWRYLEEKEYNEIIPLIHQTIEQSTLQKMGANIRVAGPPIMVANLETSMMQDMRLFTSLTILIIAVFLFLLFKSLLSVLIPLLCVSVSLICTVGLMAWAGQPLQVPSVILPSFILAVGVGDAVHLLTIYFKHLSEHKSHQNQAMTAALEHTFVPMLLTSLTTAAGLFSFSQTDLVPIANLGLFSSIGVLIAFSLTVSLLPAMLILIHGKQTVKKEFQHEWMNTFINTCMFLAFKHPLKVMLTTSLILILALYSAMQLHFSHNPMSWIPKDWPVHEATATIDKNMGGTVAIEMLIDSGEHQGLYSTAFMNALDALNQDLMEIKSDHIQPSKVLSIVEMLKETEQALHENKASAYGIPSTNELIAQQLFLLEMSAADDLYKLIDRNHQIARISITTPWVDTTYYYEVIETSEALAKQHFPNAKISSTGIIPIFGSTLTEVIYATAKSYVLAFVVISIMMVLLLRSVGFGAMAMIPNLSPIIIVMGLLYWTGAPLDMFTMLIGSIAIGLSVDDTVHFMYHYKQYREQGLDNQQAIESTLHSSGRAMLITSIVLACGFFIFMASSMNNLFFFGLFTGLTILLALLADFILAPALLMKVHGILYKEK